MHPTLLVGPYDWDPELVPKKEFTDRIRVFWEHVSNNECSAAVVYGDNRNHGELAYLSNFIPKLGPALLLMQRHSEPTLLVSGAPNMLPAARRMTWIEKTQPLRDAGKAVTEWLRESGGSDGSTSPHPVALIGGEYMRSALYRSLSEAFGLENAVADATPTLLSLMRHKRAVELAAIRGACAILDAASKALAQAKSSNATVTEAILEAEGVAHRTGAQDVRTLFSLDGGRTLRPFESPINRGLDPLQAYIAVRHAGYWADGFMALANELHPAMTRAAVALRAVIKIATAGTTYENLARVVGEIIKPYHGHAVTSANMGNGIGQSLVEEPCLLAGSEEPLAAGCVYTLRVGASDGKEDHAIVSAMVAVNQRGNDVLWLAT